MKNMFRIYPENGKYIPDILPNGKRIESVTDMPLNRAEFLKCKAYATICALVGEPPKEVIVNTKTYEEAIAVFNGLREVIDEIQSHFEEPSKDVDETPVEVPEVKEPDPQVEELKPVEDETPLEASEPLPEADGAEKEFVPEVEPEQTEEKVEEPAEEVEVPDEQVEDPDDKSEDELPDEHNDNRSQENSSQGQQTGYMSFDKKRNNQTKNKKKH